MVATSFTQSSGSTSFTATLPTGSAAGDTLVAMIAGGDETLDASMASAGWVNIADNWTAGGLAWNCSIHVLTLTSTHISAGNVTIYNNTGGGGTFQKEVFLATFSGDVNVISPRILFSMTSATINGRPFGFPGQLQTGDIILAAATGRGNGSSAAITPGTQVQFHNSSNGSMVANTYTLTSAAHPAFKATNIVSAYQYVLMLAVIRAD